MIIVVGGSARKAGKTTVVCEIIAATQEARWNAVKISPHRHELHPRGDTERYAEAGAAHAMLVQGSDALILSGNTIIESNSILDKIEPDLFVFVDGGGEWKPSAQHHASKADCVLRGHVSPELLERIRDTLRASECRLDNVQ